MDPAALRSFDRLLRRMDRRAARPPRRFSTSPFVLGFGLVLADLLLTRLVPMIWENTLPGGLAQAAYFRGAPALVRAAAVFCYPRQPQVLAATAVVTVVALGVGSRSRAARLLVWLLACAVIALNAAILAVALRASLEASPIHQGFGGEPF